MGRSWSVLVKDKVNREMIRSSESYFKRRIYGEKQREGTSLVEEDTSLIIRPGRNWRSTYSIHACDSVRFSKLVNCNFFCGDTPVPSSADDIIRRGDDQSPMHF